MWKGYGKFACNVRSLCTLQVINRVIYRTANGVTCTTRFTNKFTFNENAYFSSALYEKYLR